MTNLPSGRKIINLMDAPSNKEPEVQESTSGAMALDVEGQCPKCFRLMGKATACGETVHYCDSCRVSLPLSNA